MAEALTQGQKQAIFQRYFNEGYSASQAQEAAKGTDWGTRRETVLDWFTAFRGQAEAGYDINRVPYNYRPDPSRIPQASTLIKGNYRFTVEFTAYDPVHDAHTTFQARANFKDMPTRSQILEQAEKGIGDIITHYSLNLVDVSITGAVKREGW